MAKKLIIANWKLNPSGLKEAERLVLSIDRKPKHTTVLCPPHVYLSHMNYPKLGAQDCFWMDKGAYTGQVSPLQLKSLKIKYCLVGHSEKRATGENDGQINAKLRALIRHKIVPVLCVGFGTKVDQDDLEVVDTLRAQLEADLAGIDPKSIIAAYEPVWAIGTNKPATPEHAEKIALFIKTRFKVPKVLYGGSVNYFNAEKFLQQRNVDGLLVGGDSLLPKHFNQIINL